MKTDRSDTDIAPDDDAPRPADAPETDRESAETSSEPEQEEARQDEKAESADELRDKWLRAVADGENVRKRAQTDLAEVRRYGSAELLRSILAVLDNLQRALEQPPEGLDGSFLEGLKLIEQQWLGALEAHGVVPVPSPVGEAFDPEVHRAILEQPSEDTDPGSIVAVVLRGYRLHDRLLREAQVVVATAPPETGDGDTPQE